MEAEAPKAKVPGALRSFWVTIRSWVILFAVIAGLFILFNYVVFQPKPIEVEVQRIDRGTVERVITNTKAGSIRSRHRALVTADSAGRVVEIFRREGADVKKGDPILRIDDRTAHAMVEVAKRELDNARSMEAQAKVNLEEAEREFNRLRGLDEETRVQADLDKAETQVKLAKAATKTAGARTAEVGARLAQADLEVDKLTVKAPFDGVIAERLTEVGEWAVPGNPLFRIMDPNSLYVRAELDEVDIGDIRKGLPARMKLNPFPGRKFEGTITRVAPTISEALEQNRTIEIEVEFKALPEGIDLRPGTSADVEVILETTDDQALRIPTLAIMEGSRVLVADGERAREAKIETGLRNWEWTEVKSGLKEGDPIITSLDSEDVKADALIKIKE